MYKSTKSDKRPVGEFCFEPNREKERGQSLSIILIFVSQPPRALILCHTKKQATISLGHNSNSLVIILCRFKFEIYHFFICITKYVKLETLFKHKNKLGYLLDRNVTFSDLHHEP